jgi:hypothetical protein
MITTNPIAPVIARLPAQKGVKAAVFTVLSGAHARLPPTIQFTGPQTAEQSGAVCGSGATDGWAAHRYGPGTWVTV